METRQTEPNPSQNFEKSPTHPSPPARPKSIVQRQFLLNWGKTVADVRIPGTNLFL